MSAINLGQPAQAAVVPYVARRNRNQEAMANAAKTVSNVALGGSCILARAAAQTAAEAVCSPVPAAARNIVVDSCLLPARVVIQNAANNCIDSDVCYGNEDSCISKTTIWVKDQF